jgi:maltooligosyltrehalose trehalohydrolase
VHTLLTGERRGYYRDFGTVGHLAKAIREGFVYSGEYSPFHKRSHGSSSADLPPEKLTVCSQNHDQIGNRMLGERLSHLVPFEKLKLAAGVTLLSPGVPLLFMGEEYGETAPFQYFVSHGSDELIEAVRKGRAREFAAFSWQEETPDPQSEATFHACKLDHSRRTRGHHRALYEFYRELIRLRKSEKLLAQPDKERTEVASDEENRILTQRRWDSTFEVFIACNFSDNEQSVHVSGIRRNWRVLIDSANATWSGPGTTALSPHTSGSRVTLTLAPHSLVALISET